MTLRKLIAAVEAGTATGGPDAMFVPRDMSELIAAVTGSDDDLWSAFAGAHDGSLDDAKALHEALLPDWSVLEIDQDRAKRGRAEWIVCIRDDLERIDPGHCVTTENDMLSRAWLLAVLRALEAEGKA